MEKIRIIAAKLDTQELILYKEDGDTVTIPQGDVRIRNILDIATGPLSRNEVVEIDLAGVNHYEEFEEKSSGVVKFFRVLKKAVKHIFNPETDAPHEEPVMLGNPNPVVAKPAPVSTGPTAAAVRDATENVKPTAEEAVASIMQNAQSVSSPEYKATPTTEEETIIAVVDNKIIPGMENLENQFAHANKLGSPAGVEKFLKRLTAVIDKRGHSVNDLLQFMEKGDLPIADDGSIVAYKRLYTQGDCFVDPHTHKVQQRVGSRVFMNEKLVDPNRRNECSNGLHIGRRQYMGSFSGDVIVMCKINPEDVIAVPQHDKNKMRVCGYHILFKCPPNAFSLICSNRPLSEDSEAGKLLGQALRGEHVGILQTVEITQGHGGGLKITDLVKSGQANREISKAVESAKSGEAAASFDDAKSGIGSVDINKVSKESVAEKTKAEPKPVPVPTPAANKPETRSEKITRLSEIVRSGKDVEKLAAANELVDIQKKARKSFDNLGVSKAVVVSINNLVSGKAAPETKPDPNGHLRATAEAGKRLAENKKKPEPKRNIKDLPAVDIAALANTGEVKTTPQKKAAKPAAKPKLAPERAPEVNLDSMSRNQKAAHYLSIINDSKWSKDMQRQAYKDLLDLKKKSKVSWSQLNVTNFDAIQAKFEK